MNYQTTPVDRITKIASVTGRLRRTSLSSKKVVPSWNCSQRVTSSWFMKRDFSKANVSKTSELLTSFIMILVSVICYVTSYLLTKLQKIQHPVQATLVIKPDGTADFNSPLSSLSLPTAASKCPTFAISRQSNSKCSGIHTTEWKIEKGERIRNSLECKLN